jgi:hypothetical protein
MAALEAAIQSFLRLADGRRLDGRVRPGHDDMVQCNAIKL